MPLPDGYLPRRDDVLILHACVKSNVRGDDATHVYLRPEGCYTDIMVEIESVVGVHALHWDEGARVLIGHGVRNAAAVLATHDDRVWVKFDSGGFATFGATELRPEPPEAVAEMEKPGEEPEQEAPVVAARVTEDAGP